MESFARIGMAVMLLVASTVGVRLLLLWMKTHRTPELVMGIASLCIGVGSVSVVQGGAMAQEGHPVGNGLLLGGIVVTSLGGFFLCAGMWRIFRVGQTWAAGLTALAGAVLIGSFAALMLADHGGGLATDHVAYRIGISVRICAFCWVAIESLRYAGQLRRQARLGLSEPIMAHRFLNWGVSSMLAAIGYLIFLSYAARGSAPDATGQLIVGVLGTITGVSMWTAFFPPGFYSRWVEAGATTTA